jgi:hypothetical protein
MKETNLAPNFRRRALLIALGALAVVYVLWNVPAFSSILYPFRLFVTYVHEAGHSLMAILTGGQVIQFTISSDGSGLATTAGGIRALILPAGYLGAALFGALLFYLTNTLPYPRLLSGLLGLFLIVFSALFTGIDRQTGLPLALFIGILFGTILLALAYRGRAGLNILILNILAMVTGLNAVLDLFNLARFSDAGGGMVRNDAAAFAAEILPLPAVVWAVLWALIALAFFGLAVYYSVIHPLRRGHL